MPLTSIVAEVCSGQDRHAACQGCEVRACCGRAARQRVADHRGGRTRLGQAHHELTIVGRRLASLHVGRGNRDLVLDIVTNDWHCRDGGVRRGLRGVRRGGVIDVAIATAIGINVGLGCRVARRIGPGLGDLQDAVAIVAATKVTLGSSVSVTTTLVSV